MSRTGLAVVVSLRIVTAALATAAVAVAATGAEEYWLYVIGAGLATVAVWPNARVLLALWLASAGIVVGTLLATGRSELVGFLIAGGLAAAGITVISRTRPFGLKKPRRRRGAFGPAWGRQERAPSPILEPKDG